MLAVVRSDGNVTLYDANGQNSIPVTRDASLALRIYLWPTWSTDGRLALFGASADPADSYRLRVFVQEKRGDTLKVAYTSEDDGFTYAYWAPGDCPDGNCRDLALLFTPSTGSGLAVRMIRDSGGAFTDKIIGEAAPFYYSFSPDGQKMLWHRFSRQIEIYDVKGDKTNQLDDEPGLFQSPMWSPVAGEERLLFAVAGTGEGLADIVIADGDERQAILRDQPEPVSFAWSPDAKHVASVARSEKLTVTEVKSGKVVATSPTGDIISHLWSPQSDRVAYLTITRDAITPSRFSGNGSGLDGSNGLGRAAQLPPTLTWFVLDVKTGKSEALTNFIPTREMIYYLTFFDQFARSHSLWSPDGQYLAYGSLDKSGATSVMLADTRDPGKSVLVSDGGIGIWSWK